MTDAEIDEFVDDALAELEETASLQRRRLTRAALDRMVIKAERRQEHHAAGIGKTRVSFRPEIHTGDENVAWEILGDSELWRQKPAN